MIPVKRETLTSRFRDANIGMTFLEQPERDVLYFVRILSVPHIINQKPHGNSQKRYYFKVFDLNTYLSYILVINSIQIGKIIVNSLATQQM